MLPNICNYYVENWAHFLVNTSKKVGLLLLPLRYLFPPIFYLFVHFSQLKSRGIDIGVTKFIFRVRLMDGKKFVFAPNSKIKLEKKVILLHDL